MPGRVGITTDPESRKGLIATLVDGFDNWKVVAVFDTLAEARAFQRGYAERTGRRASSPAARGEGPWYVYRFDHTRSEDS